MQKALELRKKSFLPLEVCEARMGAEEEKEKEEKKNHRWRCFASIRLHRVSQPWNFPGIVRNARPFNVSIFCVWTREEGERGGGLVVFTSCTRCPMGRGRKTESFVKPF